MIFTVGHGARSAAQLVAILKEAGIGTLVDVRAYPVSRRHPQFSKAPLSETLESAGISYEWHGKALGGMRKGGYAMHMETDLFLSGMSSLVGKEGRVLCVMCAETQPEECHRLHIADWLAGRGHRVTHLIAQGEQREHAQPRLF